MRYKLLAVLFFLLCRNSYSQSSHQLSYSTSVTNAVLLYNSIKEVNIPVYLGNSFSNTVTYKWFPTGTNFGELVRLSETPIKTEIGTYNNGFLEMYRNKKGYYKMFYNSVGKIIRIEQYDSNGSTINCYNLGDYGEWVSYKRLECPGVRLAVGSSVYISNVFLTEEYDGSRNSYPCVYLVGYSIRNGYLRKERKQKSLERVSGQLAKKWVDESSEQTIIQVFKDGSMGKNTFDFNDGITCEYVIE